MPIVPESKDWTWVLERRCDECGFDVSGLDAPEAAALFRQSAGSWAMVLAQPGIDVRPDESTWSRLEYACHVRDALGVFQERLALMIGADDPVFRDWDQDAAALAGLYNEQEPGRVAAELAAAAERAASELDAVPSDAWARTGTRGDGAPFTVLTLARYFAHDVMHHLHDVMR